MPPSGILQTEMDEDQVLELEIQQELDRVDLQQDLDELQEEPEAENNIDWKLQDFQVASGNASPQDDQGPLPEEMERYLAMVQQQRTKFEQELEECDVLMNSALATGQGQVKAGENSVVLLEDWQELSEAAAQEGLTVEEFRAKLLKDIEEEPFTLEEMDFITDDSEFFLPVTDIEEALAFISHTSASATDSSGCETVDKALLLAGTINTDGFSDTSSIKLSSSPLSYATGSSSGMFYQMFEETPVMEKIASAEGPDAASTLATNSKSLESMSQMTIERAAVGDQLEESSSQLVLVDNVNQEPDLAAGTVMEMSVTEMSVAVVHGNPLLELAHFIQEQFCLVQERFHKREIRLKEELEQKRAVEERLMLDAEQQKQQSLQDFRQEERRLSHIKEESQMQMDKEIEACQRVWQRDLQQHEEAIARLTQQLREDREEMERMQRVEDQRVWLRQTAAATVIQRCYRGCRTRNKHHTVRATLAAKRKARKEKKEAEHLAEIEYEIQKRKEEQTRKVDEASRVREQEEARLREEKEEADRKKKEEQEEKMCQEAEKKRLKEEEARRKREEAERKKREAQEQKEEEKRRKKEEAERKKREEAERKERGELENKEREEAEKREREEAERIEREKAEQRQKEEKMEREKREKEEAIKKEQEEEKKAREDKKRKEEATHTPHTTEEEATHMPHTTEEKATHMPHTTEEKGVDEKVKKSAALDVNDKKSKTVTRETETKSASKVSENMTAEAENSKVIKKQPTYQSPSIRSSSDTIPAHQNGNLSSGDELPAAMTNLPQVLEGKRLAWIRQCLPWSKVSNEPWKQKTSEGKLPRRPSSAKKLSPLPEEAILAAAHAASLRQVTTVELCDLPGHSLSPLSACVNIKHLTVTKCNLVSLDGLSGCKHLQCILAQENRIEHIDLQGLGSLCMLSLAYNKLTTLNGLAGCGSLRWLDVSHNRLTKLVGLSALRRLHTLVASNNQIVTTAGVSECPTIQRLDLSSNYLAILDGTDRLCLLTQLNMAGNNLSAFPSLKNNVLLQELILRENSIGPSLDLSGVWLPLLCHLDLSQNVIEELTGSAEALLSLKRLDLAVNQITDVSSFLGALCDSPRLEDLSLLGNAVVDEDSLSEMVKMSLRCLVCLNGQTVQSPVKVQPVRHFDRLCLEQVQQHNELLGVWDNVCRPGVAATSTGSSHVCDDCLSYCDQSFRLAVEHRYAQEYGEMSAARLPFAPPTPRTSVRTSSEEFSSQAQHLNHSRAGDDQWVVHSASIEEGRQAHSHGHGDDISTIKSPRTSSHGRHNTESSSVWPLAKAPKPPAQAAPASKKEPGTPKVGLIPELSAKEKFEMALRGEVPTLRSDAASSFADDGSKRGDVGLVGDSKNSRMTVSTEHVDTADGNAFPASVQHKKAALSEKEKFERMLAGLPPDHSEAQVSAVYPAVSRGQAIVSETQKGEGVKPRGITRVTADKVSSLMMNDSPFLVGKEPLPDQPLDEGFDPDNIDNLEEMMEGLQFDLDGFLDLEQFDFDEDFLEKGWRPENTPQLPANYPVLGKIISSHSSSVGSSKPPLPTLLSHPSPAPPPGRPGQAWRNADTPLSEVQARVQPVRPPSSIASAEDSQALTTGRSKREERLAEEWGFKDSRTAELMMQRAKKMKYNAERRKKLSKLDPQQRLQLFRKLEEVRGVTSIRPAPPRVLPRKEYFQAREQEAQKRELNRQTEYRNRAGRTYEWLHTQVGDYDVSSSRINARPPAGGLMADSPTLKTVTSDTSLSQYYVQHTTSPHTYSPCSLEETASYLSGLKAAQKRHSIGSLDLGVTGQGTVLPPINTCGSASSAGSREREREREKMSWRTEPVNQSVGWGGGKKRGPKK